MGYHLRSVWGSPVSVNAQLCVVGAAFVDIEIGSSVPFHVVVSISSPIERDTIR